MNERLQAIKKIRSRVHDFAVAVAPLCKSLKWQWCNPCAPSSCPSVERIEEQIHSFLDDLKKKDCKCVSSGGITVGYEKDDDCGDQIYIRFDYTLYQYVK